MANRIIQSREYESNKTFIFNSWNEEFISKFKRLFDLKSHFMLSFDIIGDLVDNGDWFEIVDYDEWLKEIADEYDSGYESNEEVKLLIDLLRKY